MVMMPLSYTLTGPFCLSLSDKADSCTLNAVTFLKQSEVAAVNSTGQLKVWDLRQDSEEPAKTFLL